VRLPLGGGPVGARRPLVDVVDKVLDALLDLLGPAGAAVLVGEVRLLRVPAASLALRRVFGGADLVGPGAVIVPRKSLLVDLLPVSRGRLPGVLVASGGILTVCSVFAAGSILAARSVLAT
jgi:hypothetical protein